MTEQVLTFKEAFSILKRNAEKLDNQTEPDIDQLMAIVQESMQAYKTAKSRIDAVQDALKATFNDADD
jgi:exodeoxyribonuclease VII small subunit